MSRRPVDDGPQVLETGHMAVLGHTLLGSVAVLVGALRTLEQNAGSVPAADRAILEATIERNVAHIEAVARSLIHGETS